MSVPKSYENLEIYSLAMKLAVKVHKITIEVLPKYEMYEEGSQLRRSSKSIVSNVVEGFGRRKYKKEFIQYLTYAFASCDETKAHIEMLYKTGSIDQYLYIELINDYKELGAKLYNFREAVTKRHNAFKKIS